MAAAPVAQVLALSEALVVADSAFRLNVDDSPANFKAQLPGAIRDAKRGHHQSLSWAQSLYAHTRENMLLRIQVQGYTPPSGDVWLYCFLTPYYTFTSPDGTDETGPFATPVDGSYAADLEGALNLPMYVSSSTTMDFAPGFPASFTVSYAKGIGFMISSTVAFMIAQDCPWLQEAHTVHGFGQLAFPQAAYLRYSSPTPSFTTVVQSSTIPNLIPERFIGIACPELSQRRQLSSFSNVESPAFGSTEVNVFSVSYKDNGAWATKATPTDPTVLNMNPTDGVQQLTMTMATNDGWAVNAGNPWTFLITQYLSVGDAQSIASLARTNSVQNLLVAIWSNGSMLLGTPAIPLASFPQIGANVLCKPDEMMHKFLLQSLQ